MLTRLKTVIVRRLPWWTVLLLGMGCVADVFSFGMSDCGTGVSTIGQIG